MIQHYPGYPGHEEAILLIGKVDPWLRYVPNADDVERISMCLKRLFNQDGLYSIFESTTSIDALTGGSIKDLLKEEPSMAKMNFLYKDIK